MDQLEKDKCMKRSVKRTTQQVLKEEEEAEESSEMTRILKEKLFKEYEKEKQKQGKELQSKLTLRNNTRRFLDASSHVSPVFRRTSRD